MQPPKPPNGRARPARGNGTAEMAPRQLLRALTALGRGDFTARLPEDWVGLGGEIADAFNGVVERNQRLAQELDRIREKAEQLALTSKYKSEFLANMSHELRTPLNSLLILANQLAENPDGNLSPRQIEFARTIHSSGHDLLTLINDILDLSKIESGTVSVEVGEVSFQDLTESVERNFRHVAESRNLQFTIEVDPTLPRGMQTDARRLQQVIKNLLANAFKFTEQGSVSLRIFPATSGWSPEHPTLGHARAVIGLAVTDTGIGIPVDKQQIVFEAFQQAMGGTARKYAGTGLGLAISREISRLLSGELKLQKSAPGQGSTFVLYVPQSYVPIQSRRDEPPPVSGDPPTDESTVYDEFIDDRDRLAPGDRVVLVVEDDFAFARHLYELSHEKGFKALVTSRGASALALARELKPSAITLDISLPDVDGWRVLDRLKDDPATRHIPVYMISVADEPERALQQGALGFQSKPADKDALGRIFDTLREFVDRNAANLPEHKRQILENLHRSDTPLAGKKVLLVDGDVRSIFATTSVLERHKMEVLPAETGSDALEQLEKNPQVDAVLMDIMLPEMDGYEAMRRIRQMPQFRDLPIIALTAKAMKGDREKCLAAGASDYIAKPVDTEQLLSLLRVWLYR